MNNSVGKSYQDDLSLINLSNASKTNNMSSPLVNPCTSNVQPAITPQAIDDKQELLIWKNISYKSKSWTIDSKPILQKLSGILHLTTLMAILGPSGGGKSTLLKCLSFGKRLHGFSGEIITSKDAKTCYITQNAASHLFMNLNVREALKYAARLRNINDDDIDGNVERILTIMELDKVQDTLIINCSGGQHKRIAIGQELTPKEKPKIILLDEPTSGLDSNMGLKLIEILKNLILEERISIITVIHQASQEMFETFDEIYTITSQGELFYNGKQSVFSEWFINMSKNKTLSMKKNPADYIIDKAIEWNEKKFESPLPSIIQDINSKEISVLKEKGLCTPNLRFKWRSFKILFIRSFNDKYCKGKLLIFGRIIMNGLVILILTFLYSNDIGKAAGCYTDISTETDEITQNIGFQFFIILFLMFASMMPNVLSFPKEMGMFFNEHTNGAYSTSSYYLSKIFVELPIQIVLTIIYSWLLNSLTNQVDMDHWWYGFYILSNHRFDLYVLFFGITALISQGMAFAIGILFIRNFVPTVFVSVVLMVLLFIFSGFFIKVSIMGSVGRILTLFSFVRFTFEGILVILYGYGRCVNSTSTVMVNFELHDNDVKFDLYMLCANLLVWYSIGYIILRIRVNRCLNNKLKDITRTIYKNTFEKNLKGKNQTKPNENSQLLSEA